MKTAAGSNSFDDGREMRDEGQVVREGEGEGSLSVRLAIRESGDAKDSRQEGGDARQEKASQILEPSMSPFMGEQARDKLIKHLRVAL